MKYCPYCGAALMDGAVSFCQECGKKIIMSDAPVTEPLSGKKPSAAGKKTAKKPASKKGRKKKGKYAKEPERKSKKNSKTKSTEEIPEIMGEAVDDGYDGYYNDILPPDTDRVKDGMDKELVKKIVALGIGVATIILMCVALLYVL